MRVVHTASILIALSAALLASCSDAAGVLPRLSATYVLETVNGERLPNATAAGSSGQLVRLADTLVFSMNGNLDRHVAMRYINVFSQNRDTTFVAIEPFSYEIDGEHLTIYVQCPPNADCIGPGKGRIDAQSLDLVDNSWNKATLHFTVR